MPSKTKAQREKEAPAPRAQEVHPLVEPKVYRQWAASRVKDEGDVLERVRLSDLPKGEGNPSYQVQSKVEDGQTIIKINGVIVQGQAYFIDEVGSADVVDDIENAAGTELEVQINSPGGNYFASAEIVSALRSFRGEGRMVVTGLAASGAGVICLAKSKWPRIAGSSIAMFHMHNAWGLTVGDKNALAEEIKRLEKLDDSMVRLFLNYAKDTEEAQIREWMDADTLFSAEEALALNFFTEIREDAEIEEEGEGEGDIPEGVLESGEQAKVRQNIQQYLRDKNIPAATDKQEGSGELPSEEED